MSDPLADKVRRLSGQIWWRMADAHRCGLQYNETTSTETLLLSMARQMKPLGLDIVAFTQHQEGTSYNGGPPTGADWEFVFHAGPRAFRMRVQAKRLYLSEYRYNSLGPIPSSAQHQTLLNNADGAFPVYLFYNSDLPVSVRIIGNAGNGEQQRRPNWEQLPGCQHPSFHAPSYWGCALRSARTMPSGTKFHANQLMPMLPLHCLFCQCGGANELVERVARAIRRHDPESRPEVSEVHSLPEWLRLMVTAESAVDGWRQVLAERSLAGVAVFKQTRCLGV